MTQRRNWLGNLFTGTGNTLAGLYSGLGQLGSNIYSGIGNLGSQLLAAAGKRRPDSKTSAPISAFNPKLYRPSRRRRQIWPPIRPARICLARALVFSAARSAAPAATYLVRSAAGWRSSLTSFSDERLKENIEKVGETYDGLGIFKYNYLWDDTPRIGLIAQDVERVAPEAVVEIGGFKAVDYAKATNRSAQLARFLEAA